MDISPKQIASIAAAMMPIFKQMTQKPYLYDFETCKTSSSTFRTDSPMVGTGMEYRAAKDSGEVIAV